RHSVAVDHDLVHPAVAIAVLPPLDHRPAPVVPEDLLGNAVAIAIGITRRHPLITEPASLHRGTLLPTQGRRAGHHGQVATTDLVAVAVAVAINARRRPASHATAAVVAHPAAPGLAARIPALVAPDVVAPVVATVVAPVIARVAVDDACVAAGAALGVAARGGGRLTAGRHVVVPHAAHAGRREVTRRHPLRATALRLRRGGG